MNKKSYSLLELNTFIKRILALNFDQDIWVKAEILSLNIKKGHYYLTLIQKEEGSNEIVAQINATIWSTEVQRIKKTNQEKYSVDYPLQSKIIHEKTVETQLERGGFGFQNPTTRELSQKRLVEHYGKASGNAFVHDDIEQLVTKDFLIMYHHTKKWSLTHIAEYFGTTVTFLSSRMNS